MQRRFLFSVLAALGFVMWSPIWAPAATPLPIPTGPIFLAPPKYDSNEPFAKTFSLAKSADYLDSIAAFWMKSEAAPKGSNLRRLHGCGACHANFSYMMSRPLLLRERPVSLLAETRRWMEREVDVLTPGKKEDERRHFRGEAPTLAVALAFHDRQTVGRLQPTTRKALGRMWALQLPQKSEQAGRNSCWESGGYCADLSVPELIATQTDFFAAIAVGAAPDNYAGGDTKPEIDRLRTRLAKRFSEAKPNLQQTAMYLWASCHLDGLLTAKQREAAVRALLAAQRPDGGWCLNQMTHRQDWHWRWQADEKDKAATAMRPG